MRDFCQFPPRFFFEEGRDVLEEAPGGVALSILVHLNLSPLSNMLGVYYLPISSLSRSTGFSLQEIETAMEILIKHRHIYYDHKYEYVWVKNLALDQNQSSKKDDQEDNTGKAKALNPKDGRVTALKNIYRELPKLCFLKEIYDYYADIFHLDPHPSTPPIYPPPTHPLDGYPIPPSTGTTPPPLPKVIRDKQEVIKNNPILCAASSTDERDLKKQKDKELGDAAKKVIDFLNRKAGTNFQYVDANLSFIKARMREGATFQQLIAVTANKCAQWKDDPVHSKFLRPKTLYTPTNFANYVGVLPRHDDEKGDGN